MPTKNDKRGQNPRSAANRFRKGAPSPNPTGRPKGSKNRNAVIRKVLDQVVTGDLAGKKKQISVTEASLLRLSQKALTGDLKAIQMVLTLWKEAEDALATGDEARYPFSDADREVIEAIHARLIASEPSQ